MIYQRVIINRCLYFSLLALPVIVGISGLLFFSRLLSDAIGNAFPVSELFYLLLLTLLKYTPQLLSLSGFFGVFIAFYYFSVQKEMTAWFFAGLNRRHLLKPIFLFALPITAFVALFSFEISPWAVRSLHLAQVSKVFTIDPQNFPRDQFFSLPGRQYTLFWQEEGDVFIIDNTTEEQVILSDTIGKQDDEGYILLKNGHIFSHNQADNTLEKLNFQVFKLTLPQNEQIIIADRGKPFSAITLGSAGAELIWRINLPIMTLLLILSAMYLSVNIKRKPKSTSFFIALILFNFYATLIKLCKDWMESGVLTATLGILLPPIIFIASVFMAHHHLKK